MQLRIQFAFLKTRRLTSLGIASYGCLHLTEEYRPRACENKVQKRIFGHRRDEMMRGLRKLHDELRDVYSLPNILRVIK
jgi:hypothetical protein